MFVCGTKVAAWTQAFMLFSIPALSVFWSALVLVFSLSFFCSRVFILWVLIEARVILFIGVLSCEQEINFSSAAKYFLSQGFAGLVLFIFLQDRCWPINSVVFLLIIICKLGIRPFHF